MFSYAGTPLPYLVGYFEADFQSRSPLRSFNPTPKYLNNPRQNRTNLLFNHHLTLSV